MSGVLCCPVQLCVGPSSLGLMAPFLWGRAFLSKPPPPNLLLHGVPLVFTQAGSACSGFFPAFICLRCTWRQQIHVTSSPCVLKLIKPQFLNKGTFESCCLQESQLPPTPHTPPYSRQAQSFTDRMLCIPKLLFLQGLSLSL